MSADPENPKPPLAVDELSRAVLELAAERELDALVARFTDRVRGWAAPSALVAAVRDEGGGWRVLPALCFGSLPLGVERALEQLVEDLPDCLVRPTLQQPSESLPGVKVRDNWVVPWWSEGQSGLLLLRGVPRPYPPNLGDALALVSSPVWPRLLGGPASRVESLVDRIQQLSAQLSSEAGRQIERLRAASVAPPPPASEPAADAAASAADPAVVERLESELRSAREEAQRTREDAEGARQETQRTREEAERAREEAERARERMAAQQEEASRLAEKAARLEGELARQADATAQLQEHGTRLQEEQAAAAERLKALEEQRGNVRVAEARARAAEEALAAAQEAIASHAGALRAEKATAAERAEEHRRALGAAEQRAVEAEKALSALRGEDRTASGQIESERASRERAEEQLREAQAAEARALTAAEALSTQAADAARELKAAREQMAAQQEAETSLRARLAVAEQDRTEALAEAEEARAALQEARAELSSAQTADEALSVVRTALVALHRSAFVPAGLRFALEDVSAAVRVEPPRRSPGTRLVILDRDLGGLEALASELEAAGIDVRIANYPEELALLLRTPGARDLVAAVCDVMAFRADQNIAGLFRSWEKEKTGLAFFLSYDPQSPVELERARRVPLSLTVSHLQRPLQAARVGEAVEALARRQARQ